MIAVLLADFRSLAEFLVHGFAVRLGVIETPEVKAADAIGVEGLRQLDAVLEKHVLLFEVEFGVELIALRTVFREWRAGPVGLEERAGNVGNAELVFVEDLACIVDLFCVELGEVLAPHAAELDPLEAEVL